MKIRTFEAESRALSHIIQGDINGFAEAVLSSRSGDSRIRNVISADQAERRYERVFHLKPNSRVQRERRAVCIVRVALAGLHFHRSIELVSELLHPFFHARILENVSVVGY